MMFTMASFPHNYLEHVKQSDRKTTAFIRGTPIYDTPYIYKGAHIDRSLQGSYVYGPYWIYLNNMVKPKHLRGEWAAWHLHGDWAAWTVGASEWSRMLRNLKLSI